MTKKTTNMNYKGCADWHLVDATDKTLGRLASKIAFYLRGKHKPGFTPHLNCGDCIVVVNVEKLRVTGNKRDQKMYYRHTGYPGGIREENFDTLQRRKPADILKKAVVGMLPRGPLGREVFRKLYIYAGSDHPHVAQKPVPINLCDEE